MHCLRAHWCPWLYYSLELADKPDYLQGRAGTGYGLHYGA